MKRFSISLVLYAVACCLLPNSSAFAADADSPSLHTEYMVEMRDGVKLATSVYLPEGDGPWPAVVTQAEIPSAKKIINKEIRKKFFIILPLVRIP